MSQEDKPVAEVLSTQVEAWQREVSALQEKIAFAIGKPVAAHEPETESFVQTVPAHCDRIVWKGTYIHLPIANAAPCARCAELECDVAHWKANHDNRVEAARLLIDRPDLPLERVKAYQDHIALQAKITEQAARIKALEAEAADRESFLKTLADTCTEAERIAIERAGRIDALEAECRKLRDALSETEAFCNRKDITIERQRKVIEDVKQFINTPISVESCKRMNASIAEIEKGVGDE